MKLSEIAKITNAKIQSGFEKDIDVTISTDTRTIKAGAFYLPLKGASFNGEDFISQAIESGAVGAFCTKKHPELENKNIVLFEVEDTLKAYLQLANYRRNKLNLKVVAITGSSGKTTTKEILASTLSNKFKIFKTPLNHNNEIGLCQTIFSTPEDTEVLIIEMGMRGLGEIELLSKYAEPDISIIANVGSAHIGRLGTRENIAKAKCEIVKYQRGNKLIAHDDELIKKTVEFNGEKIFYSINDVEILEKNANYSKFKYLNKEFELNIGGDFNIENSLSAINCGLELGMDFNEIKAGLKNYKSIEKRWETITAGNFNIINDSYNANPESMKAFVDTVFELYENYILVLGDMGELGENEINYHKQVGNYINSHKNLDIKTTVICTGNLSKHIASEIHNCKAIHFISLNDVAQYLKNEISPQYTIFLKASRTMKLEKLIELL